MPDLLPICIVSCHRDLLLLKRLVTSFEKFLIGKHGIDIIVSDLEYHDFEFEFYKNIYPTSPKHVYRLQKSSRLIQLTSTDGYTHQQLLKIFAHKLYDGYYLILDSKNFLVKPFSTSEMLINNFPFGEEITLSTNHVFYPAFLQYKEFYKYEETSARVQDCTTPFVMHTDLVKKMLNGWQDDLDFIKWFSSINPPSEFILYSIFLLSNKLYSFVPGKEKIGKSFWLNFNNISECINSWSKPEIKVAGLGHNKPLHKNELAYLVKYLKEIGIYE
jgi:hypothetical protein